MLTQEPQVTPARHRLCLKLRGSIVGFREVRAEIVQDRVDLGWVEAGRDEIKALSLEQFRQLGELLCQYLSIPSGVLGELVVCQSRTSVSGHPSGRPP